MDNNCDVLQQIEDLGIDITLLEIKFDEIGKMIKEKCDECNKESKCNKS